MNPKLASAAAIAAAAFAEAAAQSSVSLYGRVDLSVAQQAGAVEKIELRNGSPNRFGVRGAETVGPNLQVVFQLESRFNADDGTQSTERLWEGKSIVGLEGKFGRITLGREENPAYSYSQVMGDPWTLDTVAGNGTIVKGRIGITRYSNSINYKFVSGPLVFGAQLAEARGNPPAGGQLDAKPYSLGASFSRGAWFIGVGYENPADDDDEWASIVVRYDFGWARLGAFSGWGKNAAAQRMVSYLGQAVVPILGGELRLSYGQLRNRDLSVDDVPDRQAGVGYHYFVSKRTTLYADLVRKRGDSLPAGARNSGFDLGIRHSF